MADWAKIKADYASGGGSYRTLAGKYGVSLSAVKRRAAGEGWTALRAQTEQTLYRETVRKMVGRKSTQNADRLTRLLAIGDQLADKLELAVCELERQAVRNRTKTRDIRYGESDERGKPYPTRETIRETEQLDVVDAPVDRLGMQQLTAALKNLRDVANTPRADTQSLERLAALMAGLDVEAKEEPPNAAAECEAT